MIKRYPVLLTAMLLALGGCGGSSNPAVTPDPDPSPTMSGTVADGYLSGAIVCLDLNNNKKCDTDEPQTVSDSDGNFTLEATQEQIDSASIVAEVISTTVDSDTGLPVPNPYVLSSPAGETFVSPISTIVHHFLETHPDYELVDAVAEAHEQLGIAQSVELLEDYIESGETDLHETAQDIAEVLGIELAEAEDLVEENANLDDGDFPNVFAVVVDRIVDNADEILDAVTIDGNLIQITDLEQEVHLQELNHNQTVASIEEVATAPFHRIGDDDHDDDCQQPCVEPEIPTINRQTIEVQSNGTIDFSFFTYDFDNKLWQQGTDDDRTDVILGSAGWEPTTDGDETIVFNDDGTATLTEGSRQETLSMTAVDLSGLPILVILGDHDNEEDSDEDTASGIGANEVDFDDLLEDAAESIVFADGSLGIRWTSTMLSDLFEIHTYDGCSESELALYNDNCNVAHGPNGPVQSIEPSFFYPAGSDFHPQLSFNRLAIQLLEPAEGITDTGVAIIGHNNHQNGQGSQTCSDCVDVEWTKLTVHEEVIYKIDIPASLQHEFDDDGSSTAAILSVQNGFARSGTFTPAGTSEEDDEYMFNNAALSTADELLGAVADLIEAAQTGI